MKRKKVILTKEKLNSVSWRSKGYKVKELEKVGICQLEVFEVVSKIKY